MKKFTKQFAVTAALLFTALICMGIVYIDNTTHFFKYEGGFIRFYVHTNFVWGVDTNTGFIGINTTNTVSSYDLRGKNQTNAATGNGASGATSGALTGISGAGGSSSDPSAAAGGTGGGFIFTSGPGGAAPVATNDSTGGNGGVLTLTAGAGAAGGGQSTNSATGGTGGQLTIGAGAGGSVSSAATNAVAGAGGSVVLNAGTPGSLFSGWSRKGGNGGSVTLTARNGSSGTRTNSGDGGTVTITAGSSGNTSSGGNPGTAGAVNITAGNGGTGDTNANGGSIKLQGGTGATAGEIQLNLTGGATVASNFTYQVNAWTAETNSTANTNITVNFDQGVVDLYLTNNASFTNFARVPSSQRARLVTFRITPQLVNRTVVYPTLGGASFGVYCETNANSPMWTTLTQGSRYRMTFDAIATNVAVTITEWK